MIAPIGERPKDRIGADDLKEELAMSIFAVYLLYTWNYSGMERMWNKNTISDYGHKSHFPYQLRAYRMLSVALSRLQNLGIWCEDVQVCSADGEKIKKEFFEEVKKLAFQMINSFETSLSMFLLRRKIFTSLHKVKDCRNFMRW